MCQFSEYEKKIMILLEVSVGRGTPGVGPRIRVDFFALPTQPCQLLTLNDFKNVMVVAL